MAVLFVLLVMGGCVANRYTQAPPESTPQGVPGLPKRLQDVASLSAYYPSVSKHIREQGRVVVKLKISPSGEIDLPMHIDRERTDAAARLVGAAEEILSHSIFERGNNDKNEVSVSLVFELLPCGVIAHDLTADYRISLCLDPNADLWARFDFAAHPPSVLEEQLQKVLVHGNLADIDFLEQTLGLRFWVTGVVSPPYGYGVDRPIFVSVIPTTVPPTLRVQGLNYEYRVDAARHGSVFFLNLVPTECPDFALWAARFKIPSTSSMEPHGVGTGTDFTWAGEHGIQVSGFRFSGGGCQMHLSQFLDVREPFASHTDIKLISGTPLIRGIGAVVAGGDIRNSARTERALHARFTNPGPGAFGINYLLQNVIPGINATSFEYSVNDTGQEPAFSFVAVPPLPANRSARLQLSPDVHHVCIRRGQLAAELNRRRVRFRRFNKDGLESYVVRGHNEIRVRQDVFHGCVSFIGISQITDVKHAIRALSPTMPTIN